MNLGETKKHLKYPEQIHAVLKLAQLGGVVRKHEGD
jgi:hypothetical protein